jgi:hypothetical protein
LWHETADSFANKLCQWKCSLTKHLTKVKFLSYSYIGKLCNKKHQRCCDVIMPTLLALATLGNATQITSFLVVEYGQGKHGRNFCGAKLLTALPTNFANGNAA